MGCSQRGHDVTLFAPGDSHVRRQPGRHRARAGCGTTASIPIRARTSPERRSWSSNALTSSTSSTATSTTYGFELAERSPVPVVSTLHGRTDSDPLPVPFARTRASPWWPSPIAQRSFVPEGNWIATIQHGLDFYRRRLPGRAAVERTWRSSVGLSRDKGIAEAVELARLSRRDAACRGQGARPARTRDATTTVIAPAVADGVVEFLGELDEARSRQAHGRGARDASCSAAGRSHSGWSPSSRWPWARRSSPARSALCRRSWSTASTASSSMIPAAGAAAVERVAQLDRARIRQRALERFSAARMLDDYERRV